MRRVRWAMICSGAVLMVACGHDTAGDSGRPRQLKRSEMSEAERLYGMAPTPDPAVTYQPDVRIVGGGAAAIRSRSADGFRWTIDANAPHASELAQGQVFFMTNRAIGRVLEVKRNGADLDVTVGPVDISDVLKDAEIHIKDMPLDLDQAIASSLPEMPGQVVMSAAPHRLTPALFAPGEDWRLLKTQGIQLPAPLPPATPPDASKLLDQDFKMLPAVSKQGIGMGITADAGGLKFGVDTRMHLLVPRLSADFNIKNGRIQNCYVELLGAAGLSWNFYAGSSVGASANINRVFSPASDFSIPIANLAGVPFAVTVRQTFLVKTNLNGTNATIKAYGNYTFKGGFRAGYIDGQWDAQGPADFTSDQSLTRSIDGITLGLSSLNLANRITLIVGIGDHGFAAGPYASFLSAVAVVKMSDIAMLRCRQATLHVGLSGGVAYAIPKAVERILNSILSALNISYRIGDGGAKAFGPEHGLISKTTEVGECRRDPDTNAKGDMKGPV